MKNKKREMCYKKIEKEKIKEVKYLKIMILPWMNLNPHYSKLLKIY